MLLRTGNLAGMASDCSETSACLTSSVMLTVHITDELRILDYHFFLCTIGVRSLTIKSVFEIIADKIAPAAGISILILTAKPLIV